MSDISAEQFEQFMSEIRKNTGSLDRLTRSLAAQSQQSAKVNNGNNNNNSRSGAQQRLERDLARNRNSAVNMGPAQRAVDRFDGAVTSAAKPIGLLGASSDRAASAVENFATKLGMGGIIGGMIGGASNLIRTYRDMADVGQTFEGSMFSMARSAAQAGLPLDEFASIMKKNSKTVAGFGQREIMGLAKRVREASERVGNYGYSVEGITEVTMAYMEQQRQAGNLAAINSMRSQRNSEMLAKGVSDVSKAFGKSREEILKTTMDVMQNVALTSRMQSMAGTALEDFSENANAAVAAMASIPGESGQLLASFMGETLGYQTALFSQGTDMFVQGGLPQMVGVMQDYAGLIENASGTIQAQDLSFEFMDRFRTEVDANMESLRLQALAGNQNAAQILRARADLGTMTAEEFRRRRQEQEATENFSSGLLALSSAFKRLGGALLEGLFGGLENIDHKMENFLASDSFKNFERVFKELGARIGSFFANMKPEEVETLAKGISATIGGLFTLASWIGKTANFFMGMINGVQEKFGTLAATVTAVGMGLVAWLGPKVIGGMLGRMFRNDVMINAATVIVNGGVGGGFGGGGGRGRRSYAGRRGAGMGGRYGSRYGTGAARRAAAEARLAGRAGRGAGMAGRFGRFGRLGGLAAGGAGLLGLGSLVDLSGLGRMFGGAARRGAQAAPAAARAAAPAAREAGSALHAVTNGVRGARMGARILPAAGRIAGRVGASGFARGAGRVGGRVAGMLGKKIPGLGLGVAGGLAAMRLAQGDGVGAAMEGMSGAMATVPILGTIGSLLMDGAILGRDLIGRERVDGFFGGVGRAARNVANPSRLASMAMNPMMMAGGLGMGLGGMAANLFRRRPDPARPSQPNEARSAEGRLHDINRNLTEQNDKTTKSNVTFEQIQKSQREIEKMTEAQLAVMQETREILRRTNTILRQIKEQ